MPRPHPPRPTVRPRRAALVAAVVALGAALTVPATPALAGPGPSSQVHVVDLTWGSPGSGNSQFNSPEGMTVGPGGSVFVADLNNQRVLEFTGDGAFVANIGFGALGAPLDVAVADGVVYVSDLGRVVRFDAATGQLLGAWEPEGLYPTSLAVHDGTLYAVGSGADQPAGAYDPATGEQLALWGEHDNPQPAFDRPAGIAAAPDGTIYVLDADTGPDGPQIHSFTPTGTPIDTWGDPGPDAGELLSPTGIAAGPDGTIYVIERNPTNAHIGNARIQHFGADGTPIAAWGRTGDQPGQLTDATDLAVDADGRVFTLERWPPRVQRFTPTDEYPNHGYSDVPDWIDEAVRWLAYYQYATGWPDHTYRPDQPITRAQFTRMLYRLAGEPDPDHTHPFGDVPDWIDDAVNWITTDPDGPGPHEPIATGWPNNTYRPHLNITRGQTARILHRLATT